MKLAIIALSTAALIASSPAVFATGVSSKTPGHQMQKTGKKAVHGASSYAPGHRMQASKSKTRSTGASNYAPGQTTGSSTSGMSGPSSTATKSK
jgi:hypothetical protein